MIKTIDGDIIESKEKCIVHQCNCITEKSLGLSAQVFKAFPWANIYAERKSRSIPGTIDVREKDGKIIVNLFGQLYPGKPTSYESKEMRLKWFKNGLDLLSSYIKNSRVTSPNHINSVAFPYKIGCGLAGGDWKKYVNFIEIFAKENPSLQVTLYKKDV